MMGSTRRAVALALGLAGVLGAAFACTPAPPPGTFATPEEAMQALADLAGTGNQQAVEQIFGADGRELLQSGDPDADREDALRVKALILEKVEFEDPAENVKIALLGDEGWPLAIPLVLLEGRWRFDAEGGREELLNRRIGRNELLTLESLRAYVDAQREFFSQARDGSPPSYAQKFVSSEGKHDGLYWPAAETEPESPLGPFLAEATREEGSRAEDRQPFRGYYFRILEAQGASAPGGERSYLDGQGLMTGGFAALAWPAKYGNAGLMTFQINQQGIVFQKDLGPDTEAAVASFQAYTPDESWDPTGD
jgi:hypothetical protein